MLIFFRLFKKALLLISFISTGFLQAQYITHGPVFGALTSSTAKVYIRTKQCGKLLMELGEKPDLQNAFSFTGITDTLRDKSVMLQLTSLKPDTRYYYRFLFEGWEDTIRGNFRTFPAEGAKGDFTFVTGSCQETENMKVFEAMPKSDPYFLMHTGDFTYPDYMIARNYAATQSGIDSSYRKRYSEKLMKQMMYNMPIDYMYDDDDYVGASAGRYCTNDLVSKLEHGKITYTMPADTFPPLWRRNVIKGYADYFPHYDLPDTSEGIFHSFKLGNAEFFVIDRNSAKDHPDGDVFKFNAKKNRWYFAPDSSIALFGKKQMDWLKRSLAKSTADWKFIVSGVPLNGACKKLIDAGVKIQKLHYKQWFGFHIASGFGHYWAGFPAERDDLMNFVKQRGIKNILVISGDTHHLVMDDGTNAGFPEMNASGLSVSTTELAKYLKLIGNAFSLYRYNKIWNRGGMGISSKTCKNGFGKVRIVKDEYVEMSIVDEDNKVISSFKVPYQH